MLVFFFFSSRRRHTRFDCDWSSDVCSSDLLGPSSAPDQAVDIELTSGSLRHGYFNLASEVRRFFPGYKIPFTLRDGNREFPVHVTSGVAGTKPGDPEQGIQIVGGLQEFFGRHHAKPGDKVRITAMQ